MDINRLVGYALSSRKDKALARNLTRGLDKSTEGYAYGQVLPLTERKDEEDRALKIAGLIASSAIPQGELAFGEWVARRGRETDAARLTRITKLSMPMAVMEIRRILLLNKDVQEGLNWFSLANTLYFWGNGVSDKSIKVRQEMLRSFYRVQDSGSEHAEAEKGNDLP